MPDEQILTRSPRPRVISITLSESDWLAFIERHPEPVDWLRQRIQEEMSREAGEIERRLES